MVFLFLKLKRLKKELRKFNLKWHRDITGKDQEKKKGVGGDTTSCPVW